MSGWSARGAAASCNAEPARDRGDTPAGGCDRNAQRMSAIAAQKRIEQPGDRQRRAESADHGGAGRQVEGKRGGEAGGAGEGADDPADRELSCQRRREHDADGGGNDEKRKDQQHAGNRDRTGHDHAEGRIEHEFPDERPRSRQPAAQQPVQQPDRGVERNDDGNLVEAAGEDISGQDLLEMFGALRRPVDQQNGRRRGDDVDHPDQRLLRHARAPGPRERQQHGGEQSERERIAIGRQCSAPDDRA